MKYLITNKNGFSDSVIWIKITGIFCAIILFSCGGKYPSEFTTIDRVPSLFPDYHDVTIPPNISPLNFRIDEEGNSYRALISTPNDKSVQIISSSNNISIPIKKWRKILDRSKGAFFTISVFVRDSQKLWKRYKPVTISVATDPIDPYIAYRLLNPSFRYWSDLGIYQRNLCSFKEEAIFTNSATGQGTCMNCHSFCNKNPDRMMFHLRAKLGGTLLMHDNVMQKVNTKTKYTMSAGVYPSWHPNGNLIAFSVNVIRQHFFSQPQKTIDVLDYSSDLIVYNVEKNMVTTSPKISTGDMENLPEWSPDGKYLYYCLGEKSAVINKQKYKLMRIAYDCNTNTWGKVDTVLGYEQVPGSISFPKISPDGKYLLFCMSPYGYFTINYKESDLYLLNLEIGQYRKLDVNSDYTESYHSWSSNGRWFVFVSKRDDGLCARPYFCYFDTNGKERKPFLLPQKDPSFYDLFYKSYNVPEFITGPVRMSYHKLKKAVYSNARDVVFDKEVDVDALSGATKIKRN